MPKGKKRGTGTIRQLPSGKYQLRYTDPLGRQVSGGTYVTMRDAERALTRVENSISAGTYDADRAVEEGDLDPKTVTLAELAAHWRAVRVSRNGQPLRHTTLRDYKAYIHSTLQEFADKPIRLITTHQIERWWVTTRARAPRQANAAYKHLNTLMLYAVKNKYLKQNPCDIDGATTYRALVEPDVPTRDQVDILIEQAPEPFNVVVALAAWGGLRKGELLELRRKDIRLEESGHAGAWVVVSVSRGVTWQNGAPVVGAPKTRAGIRDVKLPQFANDLVLKHLRSVPIDPDALLFATNQAQNTHWGQYHLDGLWRRLRPYAGYQGRFHSLRAYAQTQFGLTGATPREIMERYGISDVATANRYQRTTGREEDLLGRLG
jgi:integrase